MRLKKIVKSASLMIPLLICSLNQNAFSSEELWESLKEGGNVVLMRHAQVKKGKANGNSLVRDPSCFNERRLSYEGRTNAEELGKIFIEKNIPIEKVIHSPFCRTTSTATIAFKTAEAANFLSLLEILSKEDQEFQSEKLSEFISSYKGKGNIILITHEPNIRAISFEIPKHLDFLVFKSDGDGDFDELGIVRSNK